MPAPKPATEKLEQMLASNQAKLGRLLKRRSAAQEVLRALNEDVMAQDQLVESLSETLTAITRIAVVRKSAEEVTP